MGSEEFRMPSKKKILGIGLGVWLAIVAFSVAITFVGFGIRWITAPAEGRTELREQTVGSGDFIRVAYDSFFDKCQEVQAREADIRNGEDLLLRLEPGSETHTRTLVNVTAARNLRAQAIAEYNADARKDWTVGQFRDSGLPFQIQEEGARTTCR